MTRQKLWIGLVVLFLAGVLTGIVGAALYWQYEGDHRGDRGPAARQERLMKKLTRDLALDSAQQAAMKPIVDRTHKQLLQLRFEHQPEVEKILAQAMADMKATLSPDQQQKLDGLYAGLRGRWTKSREFVSEAERGPRSAGQP
ncbi:hypothetical protein [Nitrospira sp. Nam80]